MNFIVDLVIQDSLRASFYVFLVIFSNEYDMFSGIFGIAASIMQNPPLFQKSVQNKSLRTFNTRSHHAFPIAIPVLLLPKSSITKQVCSNSTFKVFPRISHLATALIHNFCTLHVAI